MSKYIIDAELDYFEINAETEEEALQQAYENLQMKMINLIATKVEE